MATNDLDVRNGPDKADLLRAVTNPDQHLHVTFETPVDAVEAHIDSVGRDRRRRGHVWASWSPDVRQPPGRGFCGHVRRLEPHRPATAETDPMNIGIQVCIRSRWLGWHELSGTGGSFVR